MDNWGPTGHSMATSKEVLKNHIQDIAELKRKEMEEDKLEKISEGEVAKVKKVMEGPLGQGGVLSFEKFGNLEETDIHDMKPPSAILRTNNNALRHSVHETKKQKNSQSSPVANTTSTAEGESVAFLRKSSNSSLSGNTKPIYSR